MSYLGGKLVFGTGNSWPHDFLFFTGFFSSALVSPDCIDESSSDVSAGDTVSNGNSGVGEPARESTGENASSIIASVTGD